MYNTVICIPFRNRQQHLDYFLEHSLPRIVKHIPDVHLVVVEQSKDGRLFNRGALLNVAFQEYKDKTIYSMTHDVDINPTEETILSYYCKDVSENAVMGIYTSATNTLGGIIKFRPAAIVKCNGFPNIFWGWGTEDKALQNRCEYYEINITKNILSDDPSRDSYFTIFDDVNDKHMSPLSGDFTLLEYNFKDLRKYVQGEYLEYQGGLNTLEYKILETKTSPHVTHLIVEL
jgi:beta-1,4-galactosyltransferase 1